MALQDEPNTSLAFDTTQMRKYAKEYTNIAQNLENIAKEFNDCLITLKNDGWTTPAGSAFQKMTEENWSENINKYVALLKTLAKILENASSKYDRLVEEHIEYIKF